MIDIITDYHNHIFKALSSTEIYFGGNCVAKLYGIILGPSYFIKKEDVTELTRMGYLSQNINEYYTVSQAFKNYLLRNFTNDDESVVCILRVEKRIKELIEEKKELLFNPINTPDEDDENSKWHKLLHNCISGYSDNLYDTFISNNLRAFNRQSTVLDVMSLDNSFTIIEKNWPLFSSRFDGTLHSWKTKFKEMGKARNPLCHGHEDYLEKEQCIRIRTYCEELLKQLSLSPASL